ncbi:MAG: 4Fe-4S dicluster domain-containing protein [Deltaproteobacteria bacterium]|nr:4Fe-4S dicluster domain-containing protein [Deltaproteobacteria bacterium]
MKAFIIDVGICNGCYACQIACKDEHVGNDWSPIAKPQPDTGQFWMNLTENIRGTVPKVKIHYIPVLCMHCDKAPCIPACPIKGVIYKRDDGLVIIDADKCTGCKACVDACPYNAIFFNEDLNIAQKCTGCAHLLDGGWKVPRCVDSCPTEAIKFGEESEFKALISKAEVLKPEQGSRPRVYYLNVPGKFIAGTVYDPVEKEVVIGAKCTLTGPKAGKKATATTDDFGDFWFEGLADGMYSLKIEARGFAAKSFDKLSADTDLNLGDIPLARAGKKK